MADTLFSHDFSGNYPVVSAQTMAFEAMKEFFWAPFAKFTTPKQAPVSPMNRPRPVDSIIAMQWELTRKQGDLVEIPIHRQLKELPQTGKKQLKEHEEKPHVNFAQIPIMLQRHAELPQDSEMSTQVDKDLRLIENTRPALKQHFARSEEYLGVSYAMYYSASWNVFDSGWFDNDSKVAEHSHPHIFIAGYGKVGYSAGYPGNAAYETEIATRLSGIGASHVFDTNFISSMHADPQIAKIKPMILKNYGPLKLIVAHPWQVIDLLNDPIFREVTSHALAVQLAKENPYLAGARYIWDGFAIYVSDTAVFPCRVASSLPEWGPATITNLDSFESYSSDTMFAGMVLGKNALFKAMGSPMKFKKRVDDYGAILGIAYQIIQGYSLANFWNRDDGTTGQYLNNDSSALFVTHAAAPVY